MIEKSKFEVLYKANKEELDRIRREKEKKLHAIIIIQSFFKSRREKMKERYIARNKASEIISRNLRVLLLF